MAGRNKIHAGGRPPKFDEPRRPVTVTLPDRTLSRLAAVDTDRARAIVKLVDSALPAEDENEENTKLVEVVEVASGAAIILVAPSRCLREIPWLKLAEVTPGRHLLTIVPGTAIESLEVSILDLLEALPPTDDYERTILEELARLIGASRRQQTISKFEMLYVRPIAKRRRKRFQEPFLRQAVNRT
ncbi:MAG: hypothetical protein ACREQQ_11405 [Candidatus Binatia bacterium]